MKPRVGVRPIAGASTGLLLLVLAAFLILRKTPSVPPVPPGTTVVLPLTDTLAVERTASPMAVDTAAVARPPVVTPTDPTAVLGKAQHPAHVGVSYHWAGGRMRKRLAGELPVVRGVSRKTTIALETTVTAVGRVGKVSVLQGNRNTTLLNRAMAAVRSWRFERLPPNRKGASERCRIILTFRPPDR